MAKANSPKVLQAVVVSPIAPLPTATAPAPKVEAAPVTFTRLYVPASDWNAYLERAAKDPSKAAVKVRIPMGMSGNKEGALWFNQPRLASILGQDKERGPYLNIKGDKRLTLPIREHLSAYLTSE
jgi:hypothetical protein